MTSTSTPVLTTSSTRSNTMTDDRRLALAAFVFILLLAGALRLFSLGNESYWHDEVTMLNITLADFDELRAQTENGRPPLFPFIGSLWVSSFGTSEIAVRMLPAIAGTLAVGVFYLLARDLFNWRVAFAAALLMTAAEFQIFQSQNFRYYAVYTLVALLSFWFFYRALKTGRLYYFALYIFFAICTYYGHTHGLFVIVAQGLYFVLQVLRYRTRIAPWFISQVVIFIGILPGLLIVFRDLVGSLEAGDDGAGGDSGGPVLGPDWIQKPGLVEIIRPLIRFLFYRPEYLAVVPILLALAFFFTLTIFTIRRQGWQAWRANIGALPQQFNHDLSAYGQGTFFVAVWFFGVLIVPLIVSLLFTPLYIDRYLIASSPAYYLLIVIFLVWLRRVIPPAAVLGMILIIMAGGLVDYYTNDQNEQWIDATDYIAHEARPDDVMVIASTAMPRTRQVEETFNWYFEGDQPRCLLIELELDNSDVVDAFEECAAGADPSRFWVVALRWQGDLSIEGIEEGLPNFFMAREGGPWHLADEQHFVQIVVYRFDHESVRND